MLKFFRKIRQEFLAENKTSKYLLYALGEILLVVIGILIALQINNWNQQRMSKKTEILILNRLVQDLEKDTDRFTYLDSSYVEKREQSVAFRALVNQPTITDEMLLAITNFWGAHAEYINPQTTTYEEMVNSGKIYDISNNELVNQISEYYKTVSRMEDVTNKEGNQYHTVWNSGDIINFWYLKNLINDPPRLRKVGQQLLDRDGAYFKHLINIVGWGHGMTNRNINRIKTLRDLNASLQKSIQSYLNNQL